MIDHAIQGISAAVYRVIVFIRHVGQEIAVFVAHVLIAGELLKGVWCPGGIYFLEAENVALVPCGGFGEPNYLRWTYAASMDDIRRGLDRLEHFLKG